MIINTTMVASKKAEEIASEVTEKMDAKLGEPRANNQDIV
jgi:hypothetical protein